MPGGGRKPIVTAEKLVAAIRSQGPMTAQQLCDCLRCSPSSIMKHLRDARHNRLLAITGKQDRRQFIFGAVQTEDWPVQP